MTKGANEFVPSGKLKALELREGSGIAVSNADSGRIRYNETAERLEYSENTGVWVTLKSGLVVYRYSADVAAVELTEDGNAPSATNRILIPVDTAWDFIVQGITLCTVGTDIGKAASWYITGSIANIGGTTALVGVPFNITTAPALASDYKPKGCAAAFAAATLVPTADDTNDCLALTFTGVAGFAANTFHTTAGVRLVKTS